MKKNIFILVASAALLASCGTSAVATAPTDKGAATAEQANALVTKATEAVANANGVALEAGLDLSVKASVPGALLGLEKDLNESVSLSNLSLKAAAGVKDNKLVEAASFSGSLSAELDLPKGSDTGVSIDHKSISSSLSAKEFIAEDKVYLDGTGLFDAYSKITDVLAPLGVSAEGGPKSAEDMKGYLTLEEGSCEQAATLFTQILPALPALALASIPEGVELHNFSDGSIGVIFTVAEVAAYVTAFTHTEVPEEVIEGLDGKFVITLADNGSFACYGEVKGSFEIPLVEGANVKVEINAKASASAKLGAVNVEEVSNPESYKPLALK